MEKRKINWLPDNLFQLLSGQAKPENELESILVNSYKSAFSGELLIMFLISMTDKLNTLNIDEMNAILVGYSIGQNDMIKLEEQLLATYSKNTNGLN